MTRRLLIAAMFLLASCLVNVAVAWGCATWVHDRKVPADCCLAFGSAADRAGLVIGVWSRFGSERVCCAREGAMGGWSTNGDRQLSTDIWIFRRLLSLSARTGAIPAWSGCRKLAEAGGSNRPQWQFVIADARGWPLRSLRCSLKPVYSPAFTADPADGIMLKPHRVEMHPWLAQRILPLRPCWPGFAFNTVFYAAIAWLVVRGPFALRRLILRMRRLCPACAYPTGDSTVCTECGKALPGAPWPRKPLQRPGM